MTQHVLGAVWLLLRIAFCALVLATQETGPLASEPFERFDIEVVRISDAGQKNEPVRYFELRTKDGTAFLILGDTDTPVIRFLDRAVEHGNVGSVTLIRRMP